MNKQAVLSIVPNIPNAEDEDPGVALLISADQLLFDPNQPRKRYTKKGLEKLAKSIQDQGLQQPVVVTFAYRKKGIDYYYIKFGERRYRAHILLGYKNVPCLVKKGTYDGKLDVERVLAQTSENNLREPHSHSEMINVLRLVVEDEREKSDGVIGYIGKAQERFATALGYTAEATRRYHVLANLHSELVEMLDIEDEEEGDEREKLNFSVALSLARAPKDAQLGILERSKPHFEKSHNHGIAFVSEQARSVRESRGEKIVGRKPSESIDLVRKFLTFTNNRHDLVFGQMKPAEIKAILASASVTTVDVLLNAVIMAATNLKSLQALIQERRDYNYREFRKK